MKNFIIYFLVFIYIFNALPVRADVCISNQQAIDINTILEASEKNLNVLGNCEKLTEDLYKELDKRDQQVETLTKDLIKSKEDVVKYKVQAAKWKKIGLYSSAGALVIILLKLAPSFL